MQGPPDPGAGADPGAAPPAAYQFQMNPAYGQPNRRFKDSYDMKEELGKGGFGTVKRCVFKGAERREYAAKINNTPDRKAEQTAEADNCRDLSRTIDRAPGEQIEYWDQPCRNLVNLFDSIEEGSIVYNVYELALGGDLYNEINNREFFPLADARWCIRQILEGVHHMHCRGYIHQDLKPANILVESKTRGKSLQELGVANRHLWPVYKVTDFGLTDKRHGAAPHAPHLHRGGGTPGWNPPEKLHHPPGGHLMEYDTEADIYACGVILYQLIAGYMPFQDGDAAALALAVYTTHVEFPSPEWDGPAGSEIALAKELLYDQPNFTAGGGATMAPRPQVPPGTPAPPATPAPTAQGKFGMLAKHRQNRQTFEEILNHAFMSNGLGSHADPTARSMPLPPVRESNAWERYVANRQAKKAMLDQLFPPAAAGQ